MAKRIFAGSVITVVLIIFFAVLYERYASGKYNREGERIYVVGEVDRPTLLERLGIEPREKSRNITVKNQLKNIGTEVAVYFSDKLTGTYPENPQEFKLDKDNFYLRYLQRTDKELSKDWQIPDSWEKLNNSSSPFLFVGKAGEKYTGSAEKPVFIIKNGYQTQLDLFDVVFEDGHVEYLKLGDAEKYWQLAPR